MDFVMYVDDGYVTDAYSAAAQAELDKLNAAFKIEIKEARFSWATTLTFWSRTPRRDLTGTTMRSLMMGAVPILSSPGGC